MEINGITVSGYGAMVSHNYHCAKCGKEWEIVIGFRQKNGGPELTGKPVNFTTIEGSRFPRKDRASVQTEPEGAAPRGP